jgi:antagonist of KipI
VADHSDRSLLVLRPGLLTTVQDLGRWGHQASGVPVAGPMDAYSHRLANSLVGNSDRAAALEVTLVGPELQATGDLVCALAGGDFDVLADGNRVHHTGAFTVQSGATIRFRERRSGARATLAVRGGIAVEATFGSRATSVLSRMGPFGGRALAAGDRLPVGDDRAADRPAASVYPLALPRGGARLRAIPGPHEAMFTPSAVETLFKARFTVTTSANRMGYRLDGLPLAPAGDADILSDATPIGSIQVPRSGQPILLMADRQTTGGYPKIATVITADLPLAGQLAPGDWVEFVSCTREAAVDALRAQERRLTGRPR